MMGRSPRLTLPILLGILAVAPLSHAATPASHRPPERGTSGLQAMVEADWTLQEQRRGRQPQSAEAIQDALARATRLGQDLRRQSSSAELRRLVDTLEQLKQVAQGAAALNESARLALYRQIRWTAREIALSNPLLSAKPMVFLERHRFISQMLHEYLGYFYDYGDVEGGGVFVLAKPGRSLEVRDLIRGRLPRGNYTTLALSFDAATVYFAFAPRAQAKPSYYSPERRCFHLYAVKADGNELRQLTEGPDDDFDPCPLPDGGLAFMSTRRGGFGRCHNPWEPLPAYTLHRMDASGANLRTLSFHETNEWHPSVLADGRIAYARWDYVDRSAANFHGIWTSNPDGTGASILFGNYTMRINACYQPRAIPASNRIVFVAGAHHAAVGGSLVVANPAQTALDPHSGEDRLDTLETLTPDVCFPEAPGWPSVYYHSPWPLAEGYYLTSFSWDPLPGMGPKVTKDSETGLYYFDRFGNLELLFRRPGISAMYPVPLAARPTPPVIPSTLDRGLGDEGELFLSDVNHAMTPLPEGRQVRSLRIFQVLPKTETHVANKPRLGYAFAESARMLLGTVPVEADGSAFFRVPARKPLYFQAVDAAGRAVHSMRSVVYLQPGERRGCVGCHERPGTAPPMRSTIASRRPASAIAPGPEDARPFSFPRLVQPVLDRHCVRCHNGGQGPQTSRLVLTGEPVTTPAGTFSKSYESLRPFVRWYEWGQHSISQIVTRPGRQGADESPLTKILDDATHRPAVSLSAEERLRILVWLDGNSPFYGTYSEQEQLAQRQGKNVPPPRVQ